MDEVCKSIQHLATSMYKFELRETAFWDLHLLNDMYVYFKHNTHVHPYNTRKIKARKVTSSGQKHL